MPETIFSRILAGELPSDMVYEDEHCAAFRDLNPQAPVHVLLVPRKPVPKLSDAGEEDAEMLAHLMLTAPKIAAQEGIGDAFRLVVNNGAGAGQSVFHLHLHIIGGGPLSWPQK